MFVEGRATRGLDRFVVRKDGNSIVVNLDSLLQEDEDGDKWKTAFVTVTTGKPTLRPRASACAACLSRRAFLTQSALAAAARRCLAACGDGQIGGGGATGPLTSRHQSPSPVFPGLATVGKLVNINAQIAAKRTGTGDFRRLFRACTHQGTQIDLFQTGFLCPNHLSQFDNDGHVTVGPADARSRQS